MHEIALAQGAWEAAMETARQHHLQTIESVFFRASCQSGVCIEAFETAFSEIARDSIAQGAQLIIEASADSFAGLFEIIGIEGNADEN